MYSNTNYNFFKKRHQFKEKMPSKPQDKFTLYNGEQAPKQSLVFHIQ